MRRFLILVFFLMAITNSAFAAKQQWIDKSYDFSAVDSVVVQLVIPESVKNGIIEHETTEIFDEYFKKRLVDKLSKKNINVLRYDDAVSEFLNKQNGNVEISKNIDEEEIDVRIKDYLKNNFDLVCNITLQKYVTTTQYQPGYSIVESIPKTNTVVDSDGRFNTVTTYKTQTHYVQGGNFPIAFMMIKYELIDVKTSRNIWSRIDDEARASKVSQYFHTSPEANDLYKESLKDYFSSVSSKLIKAKKQKLKIVN